MTAYHPKPVICMAMHVLSLKDHPPILVTSLFLLLRLTQSRHSLIPECTVPSRISNMSALFHSGWPGRKHHGKGELYHVIWLSSLIPTEYLLAGKQQ